MAKGVSSCKDMTGQKFGKWTVIQRDRTSKEGAALWLMRCECGRERIFSRPQLRGNPPRCECQKIETRMTYKERERLRCIEYRKRKAAEEGRIYRPRISGIPVQPGHKRCTSCKSIKPLWEFNKNKRFKDGHGNQCKACRRIEDRKRPNRRGRYAKRMTDHKCCYVCKALKPLEEFYKNGSEGFARICRDCQINRRSRLREYGRKKYAANRENILLRFRERDRKISESLSNAYIKKMITKGTSLKYRDVPQDLIEAWRLKIKLHRELKNLRRLQNA